MTYFDCFNGDADGICALTQLRLAEPVESTLLTGVKRDINLLSRVQAQPGDQITVLDVSLDKNRAALNDVLDAGASVFYCDHHFAGEIPEHGSLETLINTASDVCTSLLINQKLNGKYLEWAVAGTFGDNLERSARGLAKGLDVNDAQLGLLQELGIYLNYNGYGASLDDLYFDPAALFQRTVKYASALDFIEQDKDAFGTLQQGYHADMAKAQAAPVVHQNDSVKVLSLPDQAWARRVSGVFGNELANAAPDTAHAVLTEKPNGDYLVSVRAPLNAKSGADEVCRQFDTGGGRAAAAGINALPDNQLDAFISAMMARYGH